MPYNMFEHVNVFVYLLEKIGEGGKKDDWA